MSDEERGSEEEIETSLVRDLGELNLGEDDGEEETQNPTLDNFSPHIEAVLKQVHPNIGGISNKAIQIMNSFLHTLLFSLIDEGRTLLEMNNRNTCTSREIQTAVRLTIPGELAKHAVSEATKAVTKFNSNTNPNGTDLDLDLEKRAGLKVSISKVQSIMKSKLRLAVPHTAAVYAAAVLEYISAEVLELSGNACLDCKEARIAPRHINLAVRGDEELDILFPGYISGGGIIPHIHKSLVKFNEDIPTPTDAEPITDQFF